MLLFSSSDHHSKLIVHSLRDKVTEIILKSYINNPSLIFYDQNVIDIDIVRALSSWHIKETNSKKVAILSFHTITHQAQNAMLKLIEEPRIDTSFIFITNQKENILPTVLSRMMEVRFDLESDFEDDYAIEFLKTSKILRMKITFIKKMLESEDKDGRKDRESVQIFCMKLEETLAKRDLVKNLKDIEELRRMISYLGDNSGSPKMILEYLSLLLPVIL